MQERIYARENAVELDAMQTRHDRVVKSFEALLPTMDAIGFSLVALNSLGTAPVDLASVDYPFTCKFVLLDRMDSDSTIEHPFMQAGTLTRLIDMVCNKYLPSTYRIYSPMNTEDSLLTQRAFKWLGINKVDVQVLNLPSVRVWFYPDPVVHVLPDLNEVMALKLDLAAEKKENVVRLVPQKTHLHCFGFLPRQWVAKWVADETNSRENNRKLAALFLTRMWQETEMWRESRGQSYMGWWDQAQSEEIEQFDTSLKLDNEVGFRQAVFMHEKYKAMRAWVKRTSCTLTFDEVMTGDYADCDEDEL